MLHRDQDEFYTNSINPYTNYLELSGSLCFRTFVIFDPNLQMKLTKITKFM